MTLEDLGNVGEFLGGIGVVVSLLYLAVQIRQNTRSLRRSAYESVVSSSARLSADFANDEGLAELWAKGAREYSTLSRPEQLRFASYSYSVFRSYENLFYQYEQGAVEAELWQGFHNMLVRDLKTPGLVEWWESQRNIFSSKFQRCVNELQ